MMYGNLLGGAGSMDVTQGVGTRFISGAVIGMVASCSIFLKIFVGMGGCLDVGILVVMSGL